MAAGEVTSFYPSLLVADLERSGLEPGDIRARVLNAAEKAACNSPMGLDGYVIPYFNLEGRPVPHYRIKLYDTGASAGSISESGNKPARYRQPAESQNHIYFPPRLHTLLPDAKFILLVEGEKKAAAGVKAGIPTVAVGGVDNWKSRTVVLPKDTALSKAADTGRITAKLPEGGASQEDTGTIAKGMDSLIAFLVERDIPIIIAYDTDPSSKTAFNVQRAAAMLGFELRFRGVPLRNIRQFRFPLITEPQDHPLAGQKVGLDDYLAQVTNGLSSIHKLIQHTLSLRVAFPLHPNIRDFVNKQLSRHNLPRERKVALALAILTDLDAKGQRLRSKDSGQLYYFSAADKSLTPVEFTGRPDFAESPFGRFLYQQYGLGLHDAAALTWLSSQFSGEAPIATVSPERVLAWRDDTLYYQINDGQLAIVTHHNITLADNGTDNVLFEAGLVDPIPQATFQGALRSVQSQPGYTNWWFDVLRQARIQETPEDRHRHLLSLLYYISPFFLRWRGTQLPVEITTGEAGSGKSTLFELRLAILTGIPHLRNAPNDLKDWTASLAATGGIHVTDNLQFSDNSLRQRLSDEVCRLTTEPKPTIEQRKLYTNTGVVRIPVKCGFGFTAIRQPFTNIDIIQRSIITELDKGISSQLTYEAEWWRRQIENRGGRAMWLAHHLVVINAILKEAQKSWSQNYKARYRLINVEQLLQFTASVFNQSSHWIPQYLEQARDKSASETDWTLEGLQAYAQYVKGHFSNWYERKFTTGDIATWAQSDDDFLDCKLLINARSLGRYITQHKHTVATVAKIVVHSSYASRTNYRITQ